MGLSIVYPTITSQPHTPTHSSIHPHLGHPPLSNMHQRQFCVSLSLDPVMSKLMEGLVIVCMGPRCLSPTTQASFWILPGPQLITINQSEGVKHLD